MTLNGIQIIDTIKGGTVLFAYGPTH